MVAVQELITDTVRLVYNSLEDRNPMKGNTVGSQSNVEKAYIAGFLDGDGSLMLQLKKRNDTKYGYRFMATICLYQDTRHEAPLLWIQSKLGAGFVTRRNDGMSELRINGFTRVNAVLTELEPFVRFKINQLQALKNACQILGTTPIQKLSRFDLLKVIDCIIIIQSENYQSNRKKSREELQKIFGLTP